MSSGKIGVTMSIYGTVLPKASFLASLARGTNISKEAKKRIGVSSKIKLQFAKDKITVFWRCCKDAEPEINLVNSSLWLM